MSNLSSSSDYHPLSGITNYTAPLSMFNRPIGEKQDISTVSSGCLWQESLTEVTVCKEPELITSSAVVTNEEEQSIEELQKRNALLRLLEAWREEGDEEEQRETLEYLKQVLDEDRLSDRKFFS